MILFQSSPVVIAKSNKNESWKLLKFFRSSSTSPSVMVPKEKTPIMENMKKMSISSINTFTNDGIENMIV